MAVQASKVCTAWYLLLTVTSNLVQVWGKVHTLLGTASNRVDSTEIGRVLANTVKLVASTVAEARHRFEYDGEWTPPSVVSQPDGELEKDLGVILEKVEGSSERVKLEFPKLQSRVTQTLDYYSAMWELNHPYTGTRPPGWDDDRVETFRSTVLLRAMRRNGTHVYRMSARHRDPISGHIMRRFIQQDEWLVAIRKQLGLGMGGLLGRTHTDAGHCSCNARSPHEFEGVFDQHWASGGCGYAYGGNATRHCQVQEVLYELQRNADAGAAESYDVTNYEDSPTTRSNRNRKNNENSAMDIVIKDSIFNQQVWVDVTVTDTTGKSNQARAPGDAAAVLRLAHNHKTNEKAKDYAHIADHTNRNALLVTFPCDTHGNFQELDQEFAPVPRAALNLGDQPYRATDPKLICKKLFEDGAPPVRGGSVLSKEEGLVIALARRATLRGGKGMGAFDQTLFDSAAAGMVSAHTYRNIAHTCIRFSAKATIQAMKRHRDRSNHE